MELYSGRSLAPGRFFVEPMVPANHVVVEFGNAFTADQQAKFLFVFEKMMREDGMPAEVYKQYMEDELKSRKAMTIEERSKL